MDKNELPKVTIPRVKASGETYKAPESTPFSIIDPTTIANVICEKKFPAKVNLCFYALIKFTKCSIEPHTFKDELIDLTNELAQQENLPEIPDGAEWDEIFHTLEKRQLVVTAERAIRLDTRGIKKVNDYYGKILFEEQE